MTPLQVASVFALLSAPIMANRGWYRGRNAFRPVMWDGRFIFLGGYMDLTFQTQEGIFNYRVCAIILHDNAILTTKNDRTPYYFLPGGRVRLHETAQEAIERELQEELGIQATILRPLWLNQGFFTEDVTKARFHELCIYYLIDISQTDLLSRGERFLRTEGDKRYLYEWIPLDRLQEEYLYPLFIKDKIHDLPEEFTILAEYE